jgi:hypothetical protein
MILKDFDSWNQVKKIVDGSLASTKIREGEVRWCKFGVNVGNEALGKGAGFKRPVLVLKKFSGDVFLAVPLTTKIHLGTWYYSVYYQGSWKCIILNQARVLDRKRLEEKIVELETKELLSVKQAYCELILS